MATTASSLARAFGIILRQVCHLFNTINEMYANGTLNSLNMSYQEALELHVSISCDLTRVLFEQISHAHCTSIYLIQRFNVFHICRHS